MTTNYDEITIDQLTDYCGYEIPKKTSRQAKKLLHHLRCNGLVVLKHDDGPIGVDTHQELATIAGAIGIEILRDTNYCLVLADPFFYEDKQITL